MSEPLPSAEKDARRMACDGSRYCASDAHWHGCFTDHDGSACETPEDHSSCIAPSNEPVECCASGRCEVCTPGYEWGGGYVLPPAEPRAEDGAR